MRHKNEALMETLPEMTQMLNVIQASTRNFIAEIEKKQNRENQKNRVLYYQHTNRLQATLQPYIGQQVL